MQMRATDIIRNVLDLIDQMDDKSKDEGVTGEIQVQRVSGDDDVSRFRQIFDLLSKGDEPELANAPNEKYAGIDSVTTLAGGGINGPKHPADIRVKDPR
jgi:hypothetical protein